MTDDSRSSTTASDELTALRARLRALEARENENALIRRAVEQSANGIVIADDDGVILFANPAFVQMHGYADNEIVGMTIQDLHTEQEWQSRGEDFARRVRETGAHSGELQNLRKDGSTFSSWISVTQLREHNGHTIGMMATLRDISEAKRAEANLRASEARFRAQFKHVPVPTYIWRKSHDDFRLTDYNDAAYAITKGGIVDYVGRTLSSMYPDSPDIRAEMQDCLEKREVIMREMSYRFETTGEEKTLKVRYAHIPPDMVLVHTEDVTQRRQAEASLRESEQLLHEAQRLSLTGSWQLDVKPGQFHLSPTMRDIHGLDRTTISLQEAFALMHPDDLPYVEAAYQDALTGGPKPLEYRIVRPNGEVRTLHSQGARLIRNERGEPVRIVGVSQDITDWKKAEQALRESEERFRQLAENIKDVFWLLDWTEQKIIYASPAYETVWGRPISQLRDDPLDWIDAIHPDDRDRAQEAYFPAAVTSYNEVYRITRPDGSLRWIHHRGFPIEDEAGRVYRMAGIAEDITEQKLAEDALRESEERYRALYDNNPSMYFTVNSRGIVTAVNEFGAEQLGYTVEELVGQPVLDIFHPDDRDEVHGQMVSCLQTPGRIAHWEYRKVRKDGRVITVEEAARSVNGPGGERVVLVVCDDVSERKRVEAALTNSERRFRTLASLAPVGIFQTDAQGDCLFVNEKWCEFTGITPEQAQGSQWPVALLPADRERVSAEWRAALEAGQEFASEFRFSTVHGNVTWLFAVALAMRDAHGVVTGYLGTITDITRLKQAEDALRASEERFRFLYDNNPSMYFTLDLDGRVLSVNQYGASQLGYTPDELIGASVFDVFHPDDRDAVRDQLASCGDTRGDIARWEFRKIRKDGRTIWVHEAARAVRGPNGETVILVVCEDITERYNN